MERERLSRGPKRAAEELKKKLGRMIIKLSFFFLIGILSAVKIILSNIT